MENVIIPLCLNNFQSKKKIDQFNSWVRIHFPHLISSLNYEVNLSLNPQWLVGFTDGDGSFFVTLKSNKSYRNGFQVQAVFDIAQISSERALLNTIGSTFFNDLHKIAPSGSVDHLRITNFLALCEFVIPFYSSNLLLTRKGLDFIIWCEVISIIQSKEHTSTQGIERIKSLRDLQNYFRLTVNPDPSLISSFIK